MFKCYLTFVILTSASGNNTTLYCFFCECMLEKYCIKVALRTILLLATQSVKKPTLEYIQNEHKGKVLLDGVVKWDGVFHLGDYLLKLADVLPLS